MANVFVCVSNGTGTEPIELEWPPLVTTTSSLGHSFNIPETTTTHGYLRHEFRISSIESVGKWLQFGDTKAIKGIGIRTVWNQFDEHGLVVGLSRNKGESNWSYKRRLLDIFIHRANSTYRGLVNGITRELGLSLFRPIFINPKRSVYNDSFIASDPYIRFDGAHLYLYSDYANDEIEHKIDRFEPGGNYEYLVDLVSFINSTTYFEAGLYAGGYEYTRSMTIINQSNRITIEEPVQNSSKFKLDHNYIVKNSVRFENDYDTFKRERTHSYMVSKAGDYHIDYTKGIITVYTVPAIGITIVYDYSDYSFRPWASPVILYDINDQDVKAKMFDQILLEDGTYANGVPTELGVDILNEILSVVPMYWGL